MSQLYIENIAVISRAELNIGSGLSVFTGETGAGKTVLMNAIAAVLGAKISKDIIRNGEAKAKVTAIFENISPKNCAEIEELGYEVLDNSLQISREITPEKTTARIGTRPANLAVLRSVAELLIDIHGQHDSRDLMLADRQLEFLDKFAELDTIVSEYRQSFEEYSRCMYELSSLDMDEKARLTKQDMLNFQLNEIEAANIVPGEDEELKSQREIIKNSQNISENLSQLYTALYGNEDISSQGAVELIDKIADYTDNLSKFLPNIAGFAESISNMRYELEELADTVRDSLDDEMFEPKMLDDIESRLATIERIKHKYGNTLENVLEYRDKIAAELYELESSDKRFEELSKKCEKLRKTTYILAKNLSQKRSAAAVSFCEKVREQLQLLNMSDVSLFYEHSEKSELSSNGIDNMQLMLSANKGEDARPLSKTASGGELSRIMLAIKVVLAQRDDISTIIFDEIDTGVSGATGTKIGASLGTVAKSRQVLCVTHLAQVAAFADNHFHITKAVEDSRTHTNIDELSGEERIYELARIAVGDIVSESSLNTAKELLTSAKKLKS